MRNPIETLAVEYRSDRALVWHRRDTRTGARFTESMGRWRVKDGRLMEVYLQHYQLRGLLSGNFQQSQTYVYRIAWEGAHRYVMDRIDIPPGVWWPTAVHIRCPAPGSP